MLGAGKKGFSLSLSLFPLAPVKSIDSTGYHSCMSENFICLIDTDDQILSVLQGLGFGQEDASSKTGRRSRRHGAVSIQAQVLQPSCAHQLGLRGGAESIPWLDAAHAKSVPRDAQSLPEQHDCGVRTYQPEDAVRGPHRHSSSAEPAEITDSRAELTRGDPRPKQCRVSLEFEPAGLDVASFFAESESGQNDGSIKEDAEAEGQTQASTPLFKAKASEGERVSVVRKKSKVRHLVDLFESYTPSSQNSGPTFAKKGVETSKVNFTHQKDVGFSSSPFIVQRPWTGAYEFPRPPEDTDVETGNSITENFLEILSAEVDSNSGHILSIMYI